MSNDKDTKAEPMTVETLREAFNRYKNKSTMGFHATHEECEEWIWNHAVAPMQHELQRLKVDYSSAEHDFDLKCEELKRLNKNMTEYATSLQQEIEQLREDLSIAENSYDQRGENIERLMARVAELENGLTLCNKCLDIEFGRITVLEGLLREYMENGHREPWYRKVTSALSGTEEKQKPK